MHQVPANPEQSTPQGKPTRLLSVNLGGQRLKDTLVPPALEDTAERPLIFAEEELGGNEGGWSERALMAVPRADKLGRRRGGAETRQPRGEALRRCPLCQADLIDAEAPTYRRCRGCGSRFSRVPAGSYDQDYYYHADANLARLARRGRVQLGHVRRLLKRIDLAPSAAQHPALRLLELGSGGGHFVSAALAGGFDAYGIDISAKAVAQGQQRGLGERLIAADARETIPGHALQSFDLVAAWELLEHMDQPADLLRMAARHLKPGGLLIGSTPNGDSSWLRALGAGWHGFDIPAYHRSYLTEAGFSAAAEQAGLEPALCCSLNEPNGLFLLKNTATAWARRLGCGQALAVRAGLALMLALPHALLERAAGHLPGLAGDTLLFVARRRA
jgi:2-polyprenyl-3-methyl-5-hydroxy-6-metoxy-1,4-benzoquinol methylase